MGLSIPCLRKVLSPLQGPRYSLAHLELGISNYHPVVPSTTITKGAIEGDPLRQAIERHDRWRRRRSGLVVILVAGVIIGGVSLWHAFSPGPPPGTGDPNGELIRSLDVVADAIPSRSTDVSVIHEEPMWANCPRDESGWYGNAEADAEFLSSSSPETVRRSVAKIMLDHGWQSGFSTTGGPTTPHPLGGAVAEWTKVLGTVSANAVLTKNPGGGDTRSWDLSAVAPPIGPQEGYCPQT